MSLSRKSEAKEQVERGERMVAMMSGDMSRGMPWFGRGSDDGEDEYEKSMDRRDELDESYRDRLYALLTPEQEEAMPRQARGGGGGWGGGGGCGGGDGSSGVCRC